MDAFDEYYIEFKLIWTLCNSKRFKVRGCSQELTGIQLGSTTREYSRIPIFNIYVESGRSFSLPKNKATIENVWIDPTLEDLRNRFCEKNNIHLSIKEWNNNVQSYRPEQYLHLYREKGNSATLEFMRYLCVQDSLPELNKILHKYETATKRQVYIAGKPFFERVRETPKIRHLMTYYRDAVKEMSWDNHKGTRGELTVESFTYPVHDIDHASYTKTFHSIGFENLPSLHECAGLTLAIIDCLSEPFNCSICELIEDRPSALSLDIDFFLPDDKIRFSLTKVTPDKQSIPLEKW